MGRRLTRLDNFFLGRGLVVCGMGAQGWGGRGGGRRKSRSCAILARFPASHKDVDGGQCQHRARFEAHQLPHSLPHSPVSKKNSRGGKRDTREGPVSKKQAAQPAPASQPATTKRHTFSREGGHFLKLTLGIQVCWHTMRPWR